MRRKEKKKKNKENTRSLCIWLWRLNGKKGSRHTRKAMGRETGHCPPLWCLDNSKVRVTKGNSRNFSRKGGT